MLIEQAYAYTREIVPFSTTFADVLLGVCAFLEKRKPERECR